jgi:YHS domain-containing protein
MVRVLLWLVLLVLLLRAVRRFARGLAQGMNAPRQPSQPRAVGLVRDPVCGTFVVPSRALSSGTGADARFFCSEKCRQAWAAR